MDVDALSFVFGFGSRDLKMGYSYDVALNYLGALGSAGSHEISLNLWDVTRRRDLARLPSLRRVLSGSLVHNGQAVASPIWLTSGSNSLQMFGELRQ